MVKKSSKTRPKTNFFDSKLWRIGALIGFLFSATFLIEKIPFIFGAVIDFNLLISLISSVVLATLTGAFIGWAYERYFLKPRLY